MNTRHLFVFTLVLAITLLTWPDSAAAQVPTCADAVKTFTPPVGNAGLWQVNANWDPFGAPNATQSVCVPAGRKVTVQGYVCTGGIGCAPQSDCIPGGACTDGLCVGGAKDGLPCDPDANCPDGETCEDTLGKDVVVASVVVEATGHLNTEVNASLTIRSDSRVDGLLACEEPSKLLIDGHVTITGVGGIIQGDWDPGPACQLGSPVPSRIEGVPGTDQCVGAEVMMATPVSQTSIVPMARVCPRRSP